MPYTTLLEQGEYRRDQQPYIASTGDLTYLLVRTCVDFIDARKINYELFNAVIGALECAKQEIYRRAVVPYEDKKIKENGDVFSPHSLGQK